MRFLFVFLLFVSASHAEPLTDEQEVLRLQKGEYYFHYLTGDFPSAMNQLAQWRSGDDAIESEADVMEAAMLLSLGLHEKAQATFEKIKQQGNQASSQSWFYLTKRWFELGNFAAVLYCINHINEKDVSFATLAEAQYMKVSAFIELGEYKKAQNLISKMQRDDIWTGFARHNFLLAMFNGNSSGQSLSLLIEDAAFYLPDTEEGRNLRDRIHLISGLHYLQSGRNRSAEKHLKSISLDGPYTPAALLQYGWGKVEQGEYEEALQPWRELQTRYNRFDPEVMESMLGVPHVLELERAHTQALKIYERSEKLLLSMKSAVEQATAELPSNPWLEQWIFQQADQSWGWMANIDKTLPLDDTSAMMKGLLAENTFINLLTEYRDLVLLTQYLTEKEENLRLWAAMVKKRQQQSKIRYADPILKQAEKQLAVAELELSHLQNELARSGNNLFSLPTLADDQRALLLSRTAKNIETLVQTNKVSRDVQQYKERWARVKGLSLWQLSEDQPGKQWSLDKELHSMKVEIDQAQRQLLETKIAKQWAPNAWRGMSAKITTLLTRTVQAKQAAVVATDEGKQKLVALSEEYLQQLSFRINDYLSQARLSIARLYDDELQRQVAYGELSREEP